MDAVPAADGHRPAAARRRDARRSQSRHRRLRRGRPLRPRRPAVGPRPRRGRTARPRRLRRVVGVLRARRARAASSRPESSRRPASTPRSPSCSPRAGGGQALLSTSLLAGTPSLGTINGTAGRIETDSPFWGPSGIRFHGAGGTVAALGRPVRPAVPAGHVVRGGRHSRATSPTDSPTRRSIRSTRRSRHSRRSTRRADRWATGALPGGAQ